MKLVWSCDSNEQLYLRLDSAQFLTRVTGGYVMLAEVVFRNVVTQRSTKVSTQLCLLSTYVCLSVSLDSSGVLSLFGKFEILLESSQQGHSGFGLKPEPKLNQTKPKHNIADGHHKERSLEVPDWSFRDSQHFLCSSYT